MNRVKKYWTNNQQPNKQANKQRQNVIGNDRKRKACPDRFGRLFESFQERMAYARLDILIYVYMYT